MEARTEGEKRAVPIEQAKRHPSREAFQQRLNRLRASPEERARLLATGEPFDYEAWVQDAGPASAEELAEMEQFLREREEERRRSLASEEEHLAGRGA